MWQPASERASKQAPPFPLPLLIHSHCCCVVYTLEPRASLAAFIIYSAAVQLSPLCNCTVSGITTERERKGRYKDKLLRQTPPHSRIAHPSNSSHSPHGTALHCPVYCSSSFVRAKVPSLKSGRNILFLSSIVVTSQLRHCHLLHRHLHSTRSAARLLRYGSNDVSRHFSFEFNFCCC